jgi:[ribosomal protein S5]-alanine N-acetyltransferase
VALDWILPEQGPVLHGQRVRLRPAKMADYAEWAQLRQVSRDFLQPWEPSWPPDDLTRGAYRRRVSAYVQDLQSGAAYPFFVFRLEDGALTGGVTLSNVRRGVAQTATLGYWCGAPFARTGLTLDAVRAAVDFAFERVGLHRLEAACVPENAPSAALLTKAGFVHEGFARGYLKINGSWRDHLLFGLLRSDARGAA